MEEKVYPIRTLQNVPIDSIQLLVSTMPWVVMMRGGNYYVAAEKGERITPDLGNSPFAKSLADWMAGHSKYDYFLARQESTPPDFAKVLKDNFKDLLC